jgi:hypothetical protein
MDAASDKLMFHLPLVITGGEPLDHPHITDIVERGLFSRIPFTNGFSRTMEPEAATRVLAKVANRIGAISFHVHDHANVGRDEVLKFFLRQGETPNIQFLIEPGKEKELLLGWADTLLRLLQDPVLTIKLADPQVYEAFYRLFGVAVGVTTNTGVIYRSGRGVALHGLDAEKLSIRPTMVDHGTLRSLHGVHLLPDGGLVPSFFSCSLIREPGKYVFATLDDSKTAIKARLREVILAHIASRLNQTEDGFRQEVQEHFRYMDTRISSALKMISLLGDPHIRARLAQVKALLIRYSSPFSGGSVFFDGMSTMPQMSRPRFIADVSSATLEDAVSSQAKELKRNCFSYLEKPLEVQA